MLPYIVALSPVIFVLTTELIVYIVTKSEAKKGN